MEPAWDFVKELARSGNIGRVPNADTDVTTSISSGETCISFAGGSFATELGKSVKIKHLSKEDMKSGFQTFIYQEGWCVLKNGNTDAAFEFANFAIDPANNTEFNAAIAGVPVNVKAQAAPEIQHMVFSSEEMDRSVYVPDWSYISEQGDAWMKRWKQEVVPLL
jgi:putative spermidine/putrescine transport system substrate-binding protein